MGRHLSLRGLPRHIDPDVSAIEMQLRLAAGAPQPLLPGDPGTWRALGRLRHGPASAGVHHFGDAPTLPACVFVVSYDAAGACVGVHARDGRGALRQVMLRDEFWQPR